MFRNKEIRWLGYGCLIVAILGAAAGFLIDRAAGMLVLGVTGGFGGLFFVFMRFRYRKIAELSELIDLVLHYGERVDIGEEEEGELSILRSEITKMTVRIREQNDALKREKKHLADSLADIAHQLRTPLTSANLVLTLMENDPDKGERKKLLRECEELFSQMDWLLTSLLKLSRLDAGIVEFNTEDVDVAGLVEEAVSPLLIPMELHDITLQKDVPADIRITGDAGWLSEAIKNILKNCMESAGDGGKIEIACEDTLLYTELTVKDNGAGFEPEQLHHIFDRFYRGKKENASGYGIGLALSKTIINRQNGTVTAKNHPAGGALFTIRFSK
ncbi:MAG: HAMP domain-containing histidine kinase [Lachnospiraceae bacterium]|nr:HAMP domain-containing histidine kinase [Lachnospiraceae bacterium]